MKTIIKNLKDYSTIIATGVTALSYFYLYLFNLDQCKFYGIPVDFIEIDLSSLLYFASEAVIVLCVIGAVALGLVSLTEVLKLTKFEFYYLAAFTFASMLNFILSFGDVISNNTSLLIQLALSCVTLPVIINFIVKNKKRPAMKVDYSLNLPSAYILIPVVMGIILSITLTNYLAQAHVSQTKKFRVIRINKTPMGYLRNMAAT